MTLLPPHLQAVALPIEQVLDTSSVAADALTEIGSSREGRCLRGLRVGTGPLRLSLIGGCHADEPVGPAMLEHLTGYLLGLPEGAPERTLATWTLVPHANPDGDAANELWSRHTLPHPDHQGDKDRAYDLPRYLEQAVRELPGEDVEFGFPSGEEDDEEGDVRPENQAIADFLRAGGPYHLHGTFHGMAFAEGPWFLMEEGWIDRTEAMREDLVELVEAMGYSLHDVDRKGEKGFHRISRGFTTRPDSRAMAGHFIALGEAETATLFRPSSMEYVRSLGGDPLTLVSEMPLFLMPHSLEESSETPPLPTGTEGRLAFFAWSRRRIAAVGPEGFRREAAAFGIVPMALRDQMRLQLAFLNEGIAAVVVAAAEADAELPAD